MIVAAEFKLVGGCEDFIHGFVGQNPLRRFFGDTMPFCFSNLMTAAKLGSVVAILPLKSVD
jgi:hypothetical protein